jgi:hypothetical protein
MDAGYDISFWERALESSNQMTHPNVKGLGYFQQVVY